MLDTRRSPLFIGVDDRLAVGARAEAVRLALEDLAQLRIVVDLPVGDHPDVARLVGDRLPSGLEIDDAQAPMTEADEVVEVVPFVVGAAVNEGARHLFEQCAPAARRPLTRVKKSGDPTHAQDPDPALTRRYSDRYPSIIRGSGNSTSARCLPAAPCARRAAASPQ